MSSLNHQRNTVRLMLILMIRVRLMFILVFKSMDVGPHGTFDDGPQIDVLMTQIEKKFVILGPYYFTESLVGLAMG
jgi:hypothetical protein